MRELFPPPVSKHAGTGICKYKAIHRPSFPLLQGYFRCIFTLPQLEKSGKKAGGNNSDTVSENRGVRGCGPGARGRCGAGAARRRSGRACSRRRTSSRSRRRCAGGRSVVRRVQRTAAAANVGCAVVLAKQVVLVRGDALLLSFLADELKWAGGVS
jgi:hypothetical protein